MSEKRQIENVLRGIARNALAAHRRGEACEKNRRKTTVGENLGHYEVRSPP